MCSLISQGVLVRHLLRATSVALAALAVASFAAPPPGSAASTAVAAPPDLTVRTVMSGLDIPWDVTFTPSGAMLVTERELGQIRVQLPGGADRVVASRWPRLWTSGETGLMGIVVDPEFGRTNRFYTCHGWESDAGAHDVRVAAWRIDDALTRARRTEVLVSGIQATSGRHGGCRLRFGRGGALFVGTGDAAVGTNPRDLSALNGKVLRVDPATGAAVASNPFVGDGDPATDGRIWTYGHRNVQGLALRPGGAMWSAEHGSFRDDEVNLLRAGGDYGWHPVPSEPGDPQYNESVPMTDFSLPGRQVGAAWSSGDPTIATSGATWLEGRRWGEWAGALAVAALKDSSVTLMRFTSAGELVETVEVLSGDHGRLRAAQLGPGNALYLTTSNNAGADRVLRVVPRG